jgi:RND family efflux transporter MFP subunit
VVVDSVRVQEVPPTASLVGTLTPLKRSVVGSAVDGRVIELVVDEGQWVTKGEPLAKLLTQTIEIELKAAQAEARLREHEMIELKESRQQVMEQAVARKNEAEALATFAKSREQRYRQLFEQRGGTSREDFEDAVAKALATDALFQAARLEAELEQGPRNQRVDQAQAKYDLAQAQVELLEDRIEKFTIKAPFDGYVVAKYTEVGAWITRGDEIAEVIAVDPMEVTVAVPQAQIAGLQTAMLEGAPSDPVARADSGDATVAAAGIRAEVRVASLGAESFSGRIVQIVPQADLKSRTFPIKVHVDNAWDAARALPPVLKAGMMARVTLPIGRSQPATLVHKDALVLSGERTTVRVVVTDPATNQSTTREAAVTLGLSYGNYVQVSGPLEKGEQVVVRGNERLRDGQPVSVLKSSSQDAASGR